MKEDFRTILIEEALEFLKNREWDIFYFGCYLPKCENYNYHKKICKQEGALNTHGYMLNG